MSTVSKRVRGWTGAATAAAGAAAIGMFYTTPRIAADTPASPVTFTEHVIPQAIPGGYQVIAVDLNKDRKLDLLALGLSRNAATSELQWFENPTWARHVISNGFLNMINAAPYDVDGDGIPEIALAHGFTTSAETSEGGVSLLTHGPNVNDPWTSRDIDKLPTAHRLRWLNVDGNKHVVLVNSPLITAGATAPEYRTPNLIVYYEAPNWTRQTMWEIPEGLQHGILPTAALTGTKAESLLSAGFNGVFEHRFQRGKWVSTKLTSGDPQPWPKSGSSDVVVGKVGGQQFLATIEPWHGNQIAIYQKDGAGWGKRQVIDDQVTDAHALVLGDFAGTGNDAVIAGERQGKRSVYIYWPPAQLGGAWTRQVLDPAMAAAGCYVADLSGDRRPDIACIQGPGNSIKWYENMGATTR